MYGRYNRYLYHVYLHIYQLCKDKLSGILESTAGDPGTCTRHACRYSRYARYLCLVYLHKHQVRHVLLPGIIAGRTFILCNCRRFTYRYASMPGTFSRYTCSYSRYTRYFWQVRPETGRYDETWPPDLDTRLSQAR